MLKNKLTKRQMELLHVIKDFVAKYQTAPTIAELKEKMGVSSDQSIYQLLQKLVEAGFVEREQGKRRSIRLVSSGGTTMLSHHSKVYTSTDSSMPSFSMTEIQKEIFQKFSDIDIHTATIYKGALFTLAQKDYHPDWMSQVANSFRGIFNVLIRSGEDEEDKGDKLRDLLEKLKKLFSNLKKNNDTESADKTLAKIEEVVLALEDALKVKQKKEASVDKISKAFDYQGAQEKAVFREWKELNDYFTAVSHYKDGYHNKDEEKEFLRKTEEFNRLLYKYILPDQIDIYENLDNIIKMGPEKATAKEIEKYSRNSAAYVYFFENIDHNWFSFLDSNELLKPRTVVGQYIVRVASEIPDDVNKLMRYYRKNYDLDKYNKFIRNFFIKAALAMPLLKSKQVVYIMKKEGWAQDINHRNDFLFYEAKSLLKKLIEGNDYSTAVTLVGLLLDVRNKPKEVRASREIIGYVDNYMYQDIVKLIMKVKTDKLPDFIQLLAEILNKAICSEEDKQQRYISMWRSYIGEKERHRYNVVDAIIDAIRDLSLEFLDNSDDKGAKQLDNLLSKFDLEIFTRIRLYLYAEYPEKFQSNIPTAIIKYLHDEESKREYEDLLQQEFCNIDAQTQGKFLSLVKRGPTEENLKDDSEYQRYWSLRKLRLVKECLDEELLTYYKELLAEDEEDKYKPVYTGTMTSWTGPTTPKKATELGGLSVNKLVEYFVEWKPKEGFGEPSRTGLSREFSQLVKDNPEKYSKAALKLDNDRLHPVYLYQYFFGLRESFKDGAKIDWQEVMSLISSIIKKSKDKKLPKVEKDEDDWNVSWETVFQYIADFLENGLSSPKWEPPMKFRQSIWDAIEHIRHSGEPDVEYEKKYGGDNMDYFTLSINTARGEAFNALFHYIFWCDRNTEKKQKSRIPEEAKVVLDQHLDVKTEPGFTIRAVYGRFFSWLYIFDKDWAIDRMQQLFPLEDTERRYAAWETYLLNSVSPDLFDDLRPQYSKAISELKKPSLNKKRRSMDVFERLISHIMIAYAYDVVEYDDDLISQFYGDANNNQKGIATNFLGRIYIASDNASRPSEPDPERLKYFWEKRVEESESVEELQEFGWWIKSGYFQDDWMLEQLFKTLEKTNGLIDTEFRVLKTLDILADKYPLLVSRCLLKIVRAKGRDRSLRLTVDGHVRSIIKKIKALKRVDSETDKNTYLISDKMLTLGDNSFREYLRPGTGEATNDEENKNKI